MGLSPKKTTVAASNVRNCRNPEKEKRKRRVEAAVLKLWDGRASVDDPVAKALIDSAIARLAEIVA